MRLFDYFFLVALIYMVLEFLTYMLALSQLKVDKLGPGHSILEEVVRLRAHVMKKDNRPMESDTALSALIFFNHLRRIAGVLVFLSFAFVIVSVIVMGVFAESLWGQV